MKPFLLVVAWATYQNLLKARRSNGWSAAGISERWIENREPDILAV